MFRDMRRFGLDPDTVRRSSNRTFNAPMRWQREQRKLLDQRGIPLIGGGEVTSEVFEGRPVPGSLVFLASWTDFFIAEADEWRPEAWEIIKKCPDLIFQILTKRHGRIEKYLPPDWGNGYPNVWLGVTAEDREWWDRRVGVLREIPARVRFVSYEPAIGSIAGCSAKGIDWVIIGGESGNGPQDMATRPFSIQWALEAIDICRRDGARPFVKQLGTQPYTSVDVTVDRLVLKDNHGGEWDEWPDDRLRIREYPGEF